MSRQLALLLASISLAECNLPRDADHTYSRIQHGTLRVGVIHHPPWAISQDGLPRGIEPQLVTQIAGQLGTRLEWVGGPEAELLSALHDRELDLVVGGLTSDDPWKKSVAFTRPFYTDSVLVVVPGSAKPKDLHGVSVAVEAGTSTVALLRKKGAVPRPVKALSSLAGPVAAPAWQLAAMGSSLDRAMLLHQSQHVMAVAPGENQWLMRVEGLLAQAKDSVPSILRGIVK